MVAAGMHGQRSTRAVAQRMRAPRRSSSTQVRVVVALAVVYVIWGSTYLAMDVAIASIPPMLLLAARFAIAGGLLYAWAVRRGDRHGDRPSARQWWNAFVTGGLLLVCGTGLVALSLMWISSGTAALLAATVPVWMAVFGRVLFNDVLSVRATIGMAIGLVGIAVLVDPSQGDVGGMLLALGGAMTWAAGSVRSRIVAAPSRPMVAAAMEMIGAAVLFGLVGLARGELQLFDPASVTSAAIAAFVYLVVAGSVVAFAAYRWLLLHASPMVVGTHAYVNPIVAVLVAWVLVGDVLTGRMMLAGAIVVVSTALVVTGRPSVPVPAQPTSGADAFAGVSRLRRIRAVGHRIRRAPVLAWQMSAIPVARGYRTMRARRRGLKASYGVHSSVHGHVRRQPEETA